jgi:hypothetical protein
MPVQAIASGPNEQLQEFCRRTQTWCRNCVPEQLVEMIEHAYLNLLARYEIAYQPVSVSPADLKVRMQTLNGWGETLIAAGRQPRAGA